MGLLVRGILTSIALLVAGVANAAIYQCTDASGRKVFQDTPCSAGQKPLDVPASSSSRPKPAEPQGPTTKPSEAALAADDSELVEGRWEITNQKFAGDPLQPVAPAKTTKECIGPGWLQQQARTHKEISAIGGDWCKETSGELTATHWRASLTCDAEGSTAKIEQDVVFSGKSMRGEVDARGIKDGKEWREVDRVTGRWLEPC